MASGDRSRLKGLIYAFIFVAAAVYFLPSVFPGLSFIRAVFDNPVVDTLFTFTLLFLALVLVWDVFSS